MEATATASPRAPITFVYRDALLRFSAFGMLAMLWLCALLLLVRRLAGGLVRAPDGIVLLIAFGTLILAGFAVRITGRRIKRRGYRSISSSLGTDHILRFGPTGALATFAAAVSLPTSPWWHLVLLWTAFVATEIWLARPFRATATRTLPRTSNAAPPASTATQEGVWQEDQRIRQAWTRFREEDDTEVIQGTFRSQLPPGGRSTVLHIAFCPPFAKIPQLDFEQREGPPARIKASTILPHGARIEVRLPRSEDESVTIAVEIVARGVVNSTFQ